MVVILNMVVRVMKMNDGGDDDGEEDYCGDNSDYIFDGGPLMMVVVIMVVVMNDGGDDDGGYN